MDRLTQKVDVRWSDLDPNGHVRHSVYYDWAVASRVHMLESRGVGLKWLATNAIGPVLFREEARFLREVRLGDALTIDLAVAGLSDDQRKWRIRHQVLRGASEILAVVEVDGAWLDLRARKIVVPPPDLAQALGGLPRTDDFAPLKSGGSTGS